MDYHLFVLTITLVVYFIMKRYYSKKELSSNKKSGRFIYLLSVPFVMYLYKYFYLKPNDNIDLTSMAKNVTSKNTSTDVTSEPLLTELFPETSVNISSSSESS
jgi:hypothetical protein